MLRLKNEVFPPDERFRGHRKPLPGGHTVVVVGGGILGLATARELLVRDPGKRVIVVEKEHDLARHQTGRSSFVLHSGVYYTPGSLKARLTVTGVGLMLRFCEEHEIDVVRCGKVIVAVSPDELPRLDELHRRGVANGIREISKIGPQELAELEPHVRGTCALHIPGTSSVDFVRVCRALAADAERDGAEVRLGAKVVGLVQRERTVEVETTTGPIEARSVISCAGLHSDRVARLSGAGREPQIVPFRGDYYVLRPERRDLIRRHVYPVPDPTFPFLGVHATMRPDGDVWLGPNALLAGGRESYGRADVSPRDLLEAVKAPGLRVLARRHWRLGALELARGYSKHLFVRAAQRLVPELSVDDVTRGPSGIRAQALQRDGTFTDDFVFSAHGNVLHVRNAPSPGATAALAIAVEIVDRATLSFGWG